MTLDRLRQIMRLRLRSLIAGASVDRELDEELQFHVDQQIAANLERGMTPAEARTAALRAIGGVEQRKEECRDARKVGWLVDAIRDLRHGVRLLVRSPLFAIVAILSLGVAIGYPELVSIGTTSLSQSGRAIECISVIAGVYLVLNLLASVLLGACNRRVQIKER